MTIRNGPLRKNDRLNYVSPYGKRFSAYVVRAHKNGEYTIKLGYPLDEHGDIIDIYQGEIYRVGEDVIEYTFSR